MEIPLINLGAKPGEVAPDLSAFFGILTCQNFHQRLHSIWRKKTYLSQSLNHVFNVPSSLLMVYMSCIFAINLRSFWQWHWGIATLTGNAAWRLMPKK